MLGAFFLLLAAAEPANLLLVTIDTLRADRVGAYGHAAAQTPHLDRLAREGVLVEDAVVQVPQTRPSHASIFTGRQPYEHGLRDNYSPPLTGHTTLAERLRAAGYATGGFVAAYPVSRDSGLDRGFQTFDDPFGSAARRRGREDRSERPAAEVVDSALTWLRGQTGKPFFAWVHLFDPHAPYAPPRPYRQRFAKTPYDGEVAYADAEVGRLLDWLDRSGQAGRTLVVVTSDHGEGLGDHGEDEHLFFVYDSTLKVPLLLRWPSRLPAGRRIAGQFRSVDLMPTLLELLGLPPSPSSGASRAAELRQGRRLPDNESYAESLYGQLHFGYAPLRALRAEGWKYVDAPRPELYDLRQDPKETRNRMDDRAPVARAMSGRLQLHRSAEPTAAQAAIDPEAAERLAALGYVGGAFFTGPPSGADPKDKIGEFQEYRRDTVAALDRFRKRDFAGALRILERLSRPVAGNGNVSERRSFNVSFYLGRSLLELRRFAEAIPPLRQAADLSPTSVSAWLELARAQAGADRHVEALATVERGLKLAPRNPDLHHLKGRVLARTGGTAAARESLETARRLDADNPLVRVELSNLHRAAGEFQQALVEAETAVRLDRKSPDAQVARGLALGAAGREAEAAGAFKEALRLAADHPDALFFLAATELRAGRAGAAVPLLERLLKVAPDYPGAREVLAAARPKQGTVREPPSPFGP